jgi:signal transduction histidine kinase/NO-binding membrane sensor protein with MHYT domain/DNA-binding response OmpR family regulator
MNIIYDWFQLSPIPANAIDGKYNLGLVALSFAIAVLASYVALDLVGRIRTEQHSRSRHYWLAGAAVTLGAGVWTVHFIAMLAFIMPFPMEYDLLWTLVSLIIAILFSGLALSILQRESCSSPHRIISGLLIAIGLVTMHYMGMEAMKITVSIHYLPRPFILSLIIAFVLVQLALWLAFKSQQDPNKKELNIGALTMGLAIVGLQYTGIASAVFTPLVLTNPVMSAFDTIKPEHLAFFIAGFTALIIGIALTASTYYKQMVTAVRNEKEFLNAMLDNLEDGIIACDAEGKITVFNQSLQRNIDPDKIAQSVEDLPHLFTLLTLNDEQVPNENLPLNRVLNGERVSGVELIMRFKNEVSREVVIDGQQIASPEGKKLGAVIVIHDVTELKRTEKMKNEFVSIVSHELRTPLTSIRGSLGLLVSGVMGDFPEKASKLLEIANNNCERLLLLINDILDIEKIEAGKMKFQLKTVDLNSLINESIEANKMYAEKFGLTIQFAQPDSKVSVNVDPDRLMQVLANLISNACKFSPKGSQVTLSVKQENDMVRVSVADKGPGIPPEFQSRIFQKFSQADSSDTRGKGGTGLGLNISKTIIEKFGGTLHFFSKPNEGTTFYFNIPVNQDDSIRLKEPLPEQLTNKKRLLICEDDEDQSEYLKVLLESAGFEIDVANTVAEAKKLVATHDYKALLLDLILPDQDGIAFIRELRASEKTANLHIIVLSVIAQTGRALLNGDALSVVDWLDKPVDFNTLLASINRIKRKNASGVPHILHVEDNIDTQHVVGVLLEEHAIVSKASNLQEAKDMLEKSDYDLVILDLLLPDGNGSEILPLLAKHSVPVLVFSNTHLNENFAQYVSQALVKSNSTNETLLNTIMKLL